MGKYTNTNTCFISPSAGDSKPEEEEVGGEGEGEGEGEGPHPRRLPGRPHRGKGAGHLRRQGQ